MGIPVDDGGDDYLDCENEKIRYYSTYGLIKIFLIPVDPNTIDAPTTEIHLLYQIKRIIKDVSKYKYI
jgi:hypothetical protein